MPCTQYNLDQEQHDRRMMFRSTVSRNFTVLRFAEQRHQQQQQQQLQRPQQLHVVGNLGGNIYDLLDSFENVQLSSYNDGNQQPQNGEVNNQMPTSSSHSIDADIPQTSNTSSPVRSRRSSNNNDFISSDQEPSIKVQHNPVKLSSTRTNDEESPRCSILEQQDSGSNESLVQNEELHKPREQNAEVSSISKQADTHDKIHLYDRIPPIPGHRQAGLIKNYLYDGSNFIGFQKDDNGNHDVNVKIQHVDYENSYLCGYLCIKELTRKLPSLTTFFEGEIISEQYPFLTRKWEATEEVDRDHWCMFESFSRKYAKTFWSETFDYDELNSSDYIYMRWKERFPVPDHTTKIVGASYDGFYYICYSKKTASIRGYYHQVPEDSVVNFDRFQSLNLELDREGSSQVYEFR